jgi:hypothetical protein
LTKLEAPLFPTHELHSAASEAINRDAAALLIAAEIGLMKPVEAEGFKSRRVLGDPITNKDLVDEPLLGWSNTSGRMVGRYFVRDGKLVALREAGYRQLRLLVEKILRSKPFSRGFSEEFVEVAVFQWWRATLRGELNRQLSLELLDAAKKAFGLHRFMIPLANLEVERAFKFGDVFVTPFDPHLFDKLEEIAANKPPEHAMIILTEARRLRKELSHLAAVQVDVLGEPYFSQQRAHGIASDVASIFRLMSPPATSWNIRYACFPLGLEHDPQSTVIQLNGTELGTIANGILGTPSFRWKLSSIELDEYMKVDHFRNCSVFLSEQLLTPFQQRVKNAISAYSLAVAAVDLRNRMLYAMSAAEYLLLRDEHEPIQASAGDRMAFLIAKDPDARRAVVTNFKKAYGLRSRQVHHLSSVSDEDVLETFFSNMWSMLVTAITNLSRFKEHIEFLDAIDRIKYT